MLSHKHIIKIVTFLFSEKFIFGFIWLSIIYMTIFSLATKQWHPIPALLLLSVFSVVPTFLHKHYYRYISKSISLVSILIIYAAIFLGEIFNFYEIFWWWDIFLHGSSAIVFALIALGVVKTFKSEKIVQTKPLVMSIFVFSFAFSLGALWEIVEFSIDTFFGTNMQLHSLLDTMTDLIVDAIGALIVAFVGYRYLKSNKKDLIYRLYKIIEKKIG